MYGVESSLVIMGAWMLGLLGGGDGGLDCGGAGCSGECAGGCSKEALRAT